jgi:hypothetical protein
MSKKKARKPQLRGKMQRQRQNGRYWKAHRVIALILCLGLTSLILAQWNRSRNFVVTPSPSPQSSPSLQLAKEYIYAGGKLLATEEPAGVSSSLSPPGTLVADGSDAPLVNISWTASTGGTVASYHIERCENFSLGPSCFSTVTDVPEVTLSYPDSGVVAGRAYLYRVRAVDSSGNYSNYSIDLATTVNFTENRLVSYTESPTNATTIRAAHFTQLRDAVNAVRKLVNPSATAFSWTDTPPQSGGAINKSHINDLRTNLRDALVALGFPSPQYDAPDPMVSGQQVKAIHVQQLRDLMK